MILRIENLNKQYQSQVALRDLNLEIQPASIFGLIGPNGAGKTSLIRILTRILQPDSGNIFFRNEPLSDKHLPRMGYLPEERGLYRKMKVKDNLLFFAELKGLKPAEARQRLKYWIDRFEIRDWLDKRIEELSKGMQQKVQFIGTVLHQPDLIILDEPFSGFDPINSQLLVEDIRNLRNQGATILFSTHRMDSVELLCDHLALINRAEKILDGSVEEIRSRFKSNLYEITYTGPALPSDSILHVVNHSENSGLHLNLIENLNGIKPNELLQHLLTKGIQLHSFKENLPGMEEIFIRAVQSKNNSEPAHE